MVDRARVSVVVLDWNGGEETLACLEAVFASRGVEPRVLLVDNASHDSVVDRARARFPSIEVQENESNLGYAGGNNVGLRRALAQGANYVVLLNNDVRVRPDTLRTLVHAAGTDDSIAAVGVRVLRADRPDRLWMAWGEVTFRQSLVALPGRDARDGPPFDQQRDAAWVSGCAWLLTRPGLERIGFLDEEYFAYHEEVDWCARASETGMRVVYAGQAAVTHRGEGSSGGGGYVSRKQYLAARNMVRFVRRHGSWAQKVRFFAFLAGTLPFQFVRRALSGEAAGVVLKLRGVADALLGRPLPRRDLELD